MKHPIPKTPKQWLREIRLALEDARESIPFGALTGHPFGEAELFHLAPLIAMKFRDRKQKGKKADEVRKTALASYLANTDPDGIDNGLEDRPLLGFAFTYVSAHYVMDLLDEEQAGTILDYCDEHIDED